MAATPTATAPPATTGLRVRRPRGRAQEPTPAWVKLVTILAPEAPAAPVGSSSRPGTATISSGIGTPLAVPRQRATRRRRRLRPRKVVLWVWGVRLAPRAPTERM